MQTSLHGASSEVHQASTTHETPIHTHTPNTICLIQKSVICNYKKKANDQLLDGGRFSLNLVYGTMCTLLSTKSIARGWEPVRDATVTKPNPLTSRLWGSHAAAKNPHPTGTYLIRLPFMGPPMVTHAGRGHNICQESRNTSKLPLTLSRVWHIGVANPRRRVP